MFKGRPILTELRPVAGDWDPAPDVDQGWYLNDPKTYETATKKTGRAKWFVEEYKPVTVTACQKERGNQNTEGTVCGFVCAWPEISILLALRRETRLLTLLADPRVRILPSRSRRLSVQRGEWVLVRHEG